MAGRRDPVVEIARTSIARTMRAGAQGFDYFEGISAQSAGARGLCIHRVEIPPGDSARPHGHEQDETAICALQGGDEIRYGEGLSERLEVRAGQFLFIPAGMPHLPFNPSDHGPARPGPKPRRQRHRPRDGRQAWALPSWIARQEECNPGQLHSTNLGLSLGAPG